MMKNYFIYIILSGFFISCDAQQEIKINVINKSSFPIDSISLPRMKQKFEGKIIPNQSKSWVVQVNKEEYKGEGVFEIYIYNQGKRYRGSWGSYDFGFIDTSESNFYVFNNGINTKNVPLQRPLELKLFISDKSTVPFDSIIIKPESIKSINKRAKYIEAVVDWERFTKDPVIILYRKGSSQVVKVKIDNENWNLSQDIIFVSDGGLITQASQSGIIQVN